MKLFSMSLNQKKKIPKNNAVVYSYDNAIKGINRIGRIAAENKRELFFRKHFLSKK